jgi:hypothetical protein
MPLCLFMCIYVGDGNGLGCKRVAEVASQRSEWGGHDVSIHIKSDKDRNEIW